MPCYDLSHVSAEKIVSGLDDLVARDRHTTAELLAHLGEMDARKLYLEHACSSMFSYCVSRLHMSEPTAGKRIAAARAARCFPDIYALVASGELHQTAVSMLAPKLTAENHPELLAAAVHLSKREVERMIAGRFPGPDVATSMRKLPVRPIPVERAATAAPASLPTTTAAVTSPAVSAAAVTPPSPDQVPLSLIPPVVVPRAEVKPLSADRYSLKVTLSEKTRDKLLEAQALLRHRIPGGEIDAVLDRALDTLLRELHKEKFGETDKPRARGKPAKKRSRHVPNAVKREVAARDGYQCTYEDEHGRRCQERAYLEFDHIDAYARGGASDSAEGIRLRCRAHNLHAAEQAFGKEFIKRKIARARSGP